MDVEQSLLEASFVKIELLHITNWTWFLELRE